MAEDPEAWAVDSNEALNLTLYSPSASNPLSFHPEFTYPLFGDAETIYGYKGLKVALDFAAWDMRGHVQIQYQQKLDTAEGVQVDDVLEILKEYLPEDIFYDQNDFQLYLANPSFNPPGELIHTYTINSNSYAVYKSSLRDAATVSLVRRLQLFILLFIEGGSYIDTTDDRWQIYLLYEKKPSEEMPTIVGYATTYPYHYHHLGSQKSPDSTFYDTVFSTSSTARPTDTLESFRLRLSQFLILPPFQGAGHGGHFYDIIFANARADPQVQEISIEDPSAKFEDLRDRRDLLFLEENGVFRDIKAPLSKQWIEDTRKGYKMPPRQFRRVMEMALLRGINPHEETEEYKNWRLQVKERLYKHNLDALAQLAKAERIDKLQQTFKGVEDDYLRIMRLGSNGYNGDDADDMETDDEEDEEDEKDDYEGEDLNDRPTKRQRLG